MDESKHYKFTISIRSSYKLEDIIWIISNKLKKDLLVGSIDYKIVEDRPTSIEHHGGK